MVFILLSGAPNSQGLAAASGPQASWAKTYGGFGLDIVWSVQQTLDGGYLASGESGSFGAETTWVLRLDTVGNLVWQNIYGGGGCEGSHSSRETHDGGFVILTDLGACLLKLDGDGKVQWMNAYGGGGSNEGFFLEVTSDSGFIFGGQTKYPSPESPDAFLIKTDSEGNLLWWKTYGGAGWDVFTSVEPTPDGGFVAAGETESFGAGGFDAWVVKVDALGNVGWQKAYGGSRTDRILSISWASDGSLVGAGGSNSFGQGPLFFDIWIIKIDLEGNLVWQKIYGGSQAISVQETSDGNFIVAGVIGGDAGFLKLDNDGNVVWQRTYGGDRDDDAFSVRQTSDGGFIGAGLTKSFGVIGEEGSGDAWVIRLDAQGNLRGQCHQKGPSKVATANSLAQVTTTTVTGIDVVTIPIVVTSTVASTSAVVGVQCLISRRP